MTRTLDAKLADIHANPSSSKAFIIADAKDADMAFGIRAPGPRQAVGPEGGSAWKSLEDFRNQIRDVVRQGIVDIVLLSASNLEVLAREERLFEDSAVTPAARANDSTDIWAIRGSSYAREASRPFQSTTIDHIMYGRLDPEPGAPVTCAELGLYSVTFTNNLEADAETLRAFKEFRLEAERKGFRYFLEVFDPNVRTGIVDEEVPAFMNDHIIRSLAGVTRRGRPLFLKIPYHGPRALEELVSYDPDLIVGILGGSAGTTYDAFKLIADAQKYGARAALFGRKINLSEHPLTFIEMLRRIVEHEVSPEEAVKAYHGQLQGLGIPPHRTLEEDLSLSGR